MSLNQDNYMKYQALVSECENALDKNRTWDSCQNQSGETCRVLVTGKSGGLQESIDGKEHEAIDNNNSYCVPTVGENMGMYMHDRNTGKVFFFDNLGNLVRHSNPTESWMRNSNWKLSHDKNGITSDAFLQPRQMSNIASFGGSLFTSKEMDDTSVKTIDPEILRGNMNLAQRARLIQRNMQMLHESIAGKTYKKANDETIDIIEELKNISKAQTKGMGWFKAYGEDAV